jgi:hypothetical protein
MLGGGPCTGGNMYGRRWILYLGKVRLEHVVQANNRNLISPPMDIISSQRGFFLWEVFIHQALNFVTLFQKYF